MIQAEYDYDVAIIGGGSGGYAAARTTAKAGLRTVVIEGGKEIGGLCILRGCMPTKAMLYAAEVAHLVSHAATFGIQTKGWEVDFAAVMARKDRLIREFAEYRRQQLMEGHFDFVQARARFDDSHTLNLSTGQKLTAAYFIICTGSLVAPAPLPVLQEVGYLTSDNAVALTRLPKSLLVLGGGAVAVEFAQFFARLGVEVTLIQRSPHILHDSDTDAAEALEAALQREGIRLFTGTRLLDAWREADRKGIAFEHRGQTVRVEAAEILFALGRIPNTLTLGLETAGVKTEWGRVIANSQMQTCAPHIYAAGDCTGLHEIVHIAVQQGEVAAHNIVRAGQPKEVDYRLFTSIIFTEPQLAQVGLTEKAAQAQAKPYVAARYPFNDHGKSLIMGALDGFVKLLADPKSGEILGGACVGPVGGELIHEIVVAMQARLTVQQLASIPHYHPTLAEIWTYPAEELAEQIAAH